MRKIIQILAALAMLGVLQAEVVSTMPPLTTKRPYLPRKKSGYAFVGNIEQVAYTAYAHPTGLHFMPVNPSHSPVLYLALPPEIKVLGAYRRWDLTAAGNWEHEGKSFALYTVAPNARTSKYTLLWQLEKDLPEGTKLEGFYWGKYAKGEQEVQRLNIEVVKIPEVKSFQKIPVYWSMPGDYFKLLPEMHSLKSSGINCIDIWTYLNPDEADWGRSNLNAIHPLAQAAGITEIGWIQEWWWHNGKASEAGKATLADGTRTAEQLCLSYRGEWYQKLIAQGKELLNRGIYFHSTDPEMYGRGEELCCCETCSKAFASYLKTHAPTLKSIAPAELAKNLAAHPAEAAAWADFKAEQYVSFFRDYRQAMEKHLRESGKDPKLFRFMIYSSYHRSYPGFYEFPQNYRECPIYRRTLEDPAKLAEVFDYIGPMSYTEIFANYAPYDMLNTWKDTVALRNIMHDKAAVAPILSAGYPYIYAFDCDINAPMLQYVILEAIAGGARGFGFWGECPFDAKDQKFVAEAVGMLSPYEDWILSGRPDDSLVSADNAMVKCVNSPHGALIFVSEYSDRPLTVTVKVSPQLQGKVRDLQLQKDIAALDADSQVFQLQMDAVHRVRVFAITKEK